MVIFIARNKSNTDMDIRGSTDLKYCIAVQEILRKEVVVKADSIDDARDLVRQKYNNEDIVLGAEDLISMTHDECIFPATWYEEDEIQEMDYDLFVK